MTLPTISTTINILSDGRVIDTGKVTSVTSSDILDGVTVRNPGEVGQTYALNYRSETLRTWEVAA